MGVVYNSGMYCVVGLCVVGGVQGCWARGADRASNTGHLVEVPGWDDQLDLGQVVAVDVNLDNDPVILHRGPVTWGALSYDWNNVLRNKRVIEEDTVLTLDAATGAVLWHHQVWTTDYHRLDREY